jgi:hypothetical protein
LKPLVRIRLGLLASFLFLSSGSQAGQSPTSIPKNSEAGEAFDVAQAMTTFYGNYDVRRQTSITQLPKNTTSLPAPGEEQMTVRVLFRSFVGESVARSLFLVTYAVPSNDDTYGCHLCAPVIGMSVFRWSGGKWTMDASNRAVTFAGEWGKPPRHVELVQIGSHRTAVKIIDVGKGNGETTAILDILVPWNHTVKLGLQRTIADDDKGLCDPTGLPCYQNHRTISFAPHDDPEYFDIELKLSGTDLPLNDSTPHGRSRKVSGLEIFRFDNGTYRLVSQDGDRTFFDEAVAKRKTKD